MVMVTFVMYISYFLYLSSVLCTALFNDQISVVRIGLDGRTGSTADHFVFLLNVYQFNCWSDHWFERYNCVEP